MQKTERYYQREFKDAVHKQLSKGIVNQLGVLATGTGKSFSATSLISELKVKGFGRVIWGTHLEELVEQSALALLVELDLMPEITLKSIINNAGGLLELIRNNKNDMFLDDNTRLILSNIGIVKADLFDIDKPIVVASMQTLWRRLDRIPPNWFDIFVCDEAHLFPSNTFKKSLDYFQVKLRLGLTATPHREDGMQPGDIFDEIVYEYGIDKGIADGFLCELDARRVTSNVNIDTVKTVAGDLNQKELEVLVNTPARNQLIVDKYKEYALGRQFIAYCVDIQHALDLKAKFIENSYKVDIIVGNEIHTPDRKGTWNKFVNKQIDGLTNCMVLTTGVDYPDISCIINAAPTKSLTKFMQLVGRGTRLKSKDNPFQDCIILDIVDSTTKHRLVNTWTLDKAKTIEEKTFMTRQMKMEFIAKREAKLKINLNQKKDVKVNLLKLPKPKISDSIRMLEDATPEQLEWVKRLGYNTKEMNYTKKMCSEIISSATATDAQIWRLGKEGYDISNGVTIGEAKLAFKEIEKKKNKAHVTTFIKDNNIPFTDLN